MSLVLQSCPHLLKFKFEAGTSRGVLKEKTIWIIRLEDNNNPGVFGFGECAPLKGLSIDDVNQIPNLLSNIRKAIIEYGLPKTEEDIYSLVGKLVPMRFPSVKFALEMAMLDLLHGGKKMCFSNKFYVGKTPIPINGLIWMGSKEHMLKQVEEKLDAGFSCLKMKIGAIDFEQECDVLAYIRQRFSAEELILRVDANGAFKTEEALRKLEILAEFDLHSIEQPIMRHQHEAMYLLSQKSKVPVALDEELIGVDAISDKAALLDYIQPTYIILKPTLLGGFKSTREWIDLADNMGIGWWITSALESDIGLNAIAQFTSSYNVTGHQGLGTGQLFKNNFHSPLVVSKGALKYRGNTQWDLNQLAFDKG